MPQTVAVFTDISNDAHEIFYTSGAYQVTLGADLTSATLAPQVKNTITNVYSGSLAIPADFFGLHYRNVYTGTQANYPPKVTAKLWRTHNAGLTWRDIETSAGVYSWTALDRFIAAAQAAGATVIFQHGFTPSFYASDMTKYDAWNRAGSPSNPDITGWTNFCTAVAARYVGKIAYYEIWNEINHRESATVGNWFGTDAQMVALASAAYTAIKAADPAALVLSPNFFLETNSATSVAGTTAFSSYLAAGGGAYCDAIAWHFYLAYNREETYLPTYVAAVRAIMTTNGLGALPIICTEIGNQEIYTWNNQQEMTWELRAKHMARLMIYSAIAGVELCVWYAYDSEVYDGEGRTHSMLTTSGGTTKMLTVWNEMVAALAGRTITTINRHADRTLGIVTDAGTYII